MSREALREAKKISVGIPFSFLFQRHFSPRIHIHSKVLHWDSEVSILLSLAHVLGKLQILDGALEAEN